LFAEDLAFRRERLKKEIMAYTLREAELPRFQGDCDTSDGSSDANKDEVFYTEGT